MKTKEQKEKMLATIAVSLSVIAFVVYNWSTFAGNSRPNASSWFVWAFITILNFTSHKKLTGDWVASFLPTANSVMCIVTAVLSFFYGSFGKLGYVDSACLWIGIIAGFCWWALRSEEYAGSVVQMVLQVALVIGFIPTIVATLRNPSGEPWMCWLLWTVSFAFQCMLAAITYEGKKMVFLYPVNMLLFHAVVFVLALR